MSQSKRTTYPPGSDEQHLRDEEVFALFLESTSHPKPSRVPAPSRNDNTEDVFLGLDENF